MAPRVAAPSTARVQRLVAAKARRRGVASAEVERRFDAASAAQQSVWLAVARAAVLAGLVPPLFVLYRDLLFAAAYLSV